MQTTQEAAAILWGAVAMLPLMAALLIRHVTADASPADQRAKRWALTLSVSGTSLIVLLEVLCIMQGDPQVGYFLLAPSAVVVAFILFAGTPRLYRALGGQGRSESAVPLPAAMENQTRAYQEGMWQRLRELPHFRETLEGELISLLTGDRVFWSTYQREPCLAIDLSAKTTISGCRYETLVRYVAVQTGIAHWLQAAHESASIRGAAQ